MSVDLPLFIVGLVVAFAVLFTDLFRTCLIKMKIMTEEKDVEVDEKLGTYFECLTDAARKRWIAEEANNSSKLGIQTVGNWTMNKLA